MSTTRRRLLGTGAALLATGASARAQGKTLRIGAMYALSGAQGEIGNSLLLGTRIAIDERNKAGGILGQQIELVVRDDKYSGAGAVAAARELAGDGINLMIGGSQTVMALGLIPLLPELNAVVVSPAAAGLSLTHEAFDRHFFRCTANAYVQYRGMGRGLAEHFPAVRNWAMLLPEGEYGRSAGKAFNDAVADYLPKAPGGGKLESMDTITVGATQTDFKVQVNALMASRAEGLFMGILGAAAIGFLQQARAVGLDKRLKVIGDGGSEFTLGKALQKSLPANLWSVTFWVPGVPPFKGNKMSEQLLADCKAMKVENPPGLVMAGHRGALALLAGIEKAGSTQSDAVIAAMEGITFETAAGPYTIRKEDHQGLGFVSYVEQIPLDQPPYYGGGGMIQIPESEIVEPPSPGKAFTG
jgi:branched-chain amino acid transport system substrate-binding protein